MSQWFRALYPPVARQCPLLPDTVLPVARGRISQSAELSWEIRGAGVRPERFDVPAALGAATAYLALLQRVAEIRNERLCFTGMRIEPGSVAFKFQVDEPVIARTVAKDAKEYLEGRRLPPRGVTTRVREVHSWVERLPEGYTAHVRVANFESEVARRGQNQMGPRAEWVELRIIVMRVGGKPPKLAAFNEVEGGFTCAISEEQQAQAIARNLYREVDMSAEIVRDIDGKIVDGTLISFHEIDEIEGEAEADAWRAWFSEAGGDWDEVEDIEVELERSRIIS